MMLITLNEYQFNISAPFAAGQTINEAEAQALNALRVDGLRNKLLRELDKAREQAPLPDKILTHKQIIEFQSLIDQLDSEWKFQPRVPVGPKMGTLNWEINTVVEEIMELYKYTDDKSREVLATDLNVVETARKRLARRIRENSMSLEELLGE